MVTELCTIKLYPEERSVDLVLEHIPLVSPTGAYLQPKREVELSAVNLLHEIFDAVGIESCIHGSRSGFGWRLCITSEESVGILFKSGFFVGVPQDLVNEMQEAFRLGELVRKTANQKSEER